MVMQRSRGVARSHYAKHTKGVASRRRRLFAGHRDATGRNIHIVAFPLSGSLIRLNGHPFSKLNNEANVALSFAAARPVPDCECNKLMSVQKCLTKWLTLLLLEELVYHYEYSRF